MSASPPKRGARPLAPTHPVLQLQRIIGNQGVSRLLEAGPLEVSHPGDRFEQAANQSADLITRTRGGQLTSADDRTAAKAEPAPLGGRPLPEAIRARFEMRFGRNFSGVRIHTDDQAAKSAAGLEASAYTVGRDIVFGTGEYAPWTGRGQRLLAHELSHVAQQESHGVALQRQLLPTARKTPSGGKSAGVDADFEARDAHSQKFFALAVVLRKGYPLKVYQKILERASTGQEIFRLALQVTAIPPSGPERIELPHEGRDLLIWGSPAHDAVMNLLAIELLNWVTDHFTDPRFLEQDPLDVASYLLRYGGYAELLDLAGGVPLEHEYIDRNELVPSLVLKSFGETVATGLLVIALVGLFVGAEIITVGQATWLLVGLAGSSGILAFLGRHEEIEQKGYDVPVPETAAAAAGDIVGVSQLLEGISGRRLGTGEKLGSELRSSQFGVGTGSITTLLIGSRAYRSGQGLGRNWRLAQPAKTPAGPYGAAANQIPVAERPAVPPRNPKPGPVETRIRTGLSDEQQIGVDLFIEQIKATGKDPEVALTKIKEPILKTLIEKQAEGYRIRVEKYERVQGMKARVKDDPLRPRLKETKREDGLWIHYENKAPSVEEIAQAKELARLTGEEVHVFGDTPAGLDYPGIDGTIGISPRPLSLKSAAPEWARWHAQEALNRAAEHGYSRVTVHVRVRGLLADALFHWNDPPPKGELGPTFRKGIIAEIVLQGDEGSTTLGPSMGMPLVPPTLTRDKKKQE